MSADTRRDQIANVAYKHTPIYNSLSACECGDTWTPTHLADVVMPILDAAVAEARTETAEQIARAIENNAARVLGTYADGLSRAARIARQHGKDQP